MSLVSKRFHLSETDKATFTDVFAVLQLFSSMGTTGAFSCNKAAGREANYSSHSSAHVKSGAIPPVPS